jgi:hypothetical protein
MVAFLEFMGMGVAILGLGVAVGFLINVLLFPDMWR